MALSVLPGSSLAISLHLVPTVRRQWTMMWSSSALQVSLLTSGLSRLCQRSLHCLGVRPATSAPMVSHLMLAVPYAASSSALPPCSLTSRCTSSSSSADHDACLDLRPPLPEGDGTDEEEEEGEEAEEGEAAAAGGRAAGGREDDEEAEDEETAVAIGVEASFPSLPLLADAAGLLEPRGEADDGGEGDSREEGGRCRAGGRGAGGEDEDEGAAGGDEEAARPCCSSASVSAAPISLAAAAAAPRSVLRRLAGGGEGGRREASAAELDD